jgi:hypothetical protein
MKGLTNTEILHHEKGRFGNQLFRIGAVVGESMKRNIDYYIPKEWEHSNLFPNLKNKLSVDEIKTNISSIHREPSFAYHNIPEVSGLLEINGFFQSWKYFEGFEDRLINELSFSEENISKSISKMSKDTIKLCVHVRWGDVYDKKTGGGHKGFEKWHPTMSLNYYDNAISFVLNETKIDEILVFTDNTDTKDFIFGKFEKFGVKVVYFDYDSDYITDFVSQSLCQHFVIANSTFSWWSSFLSKNKNKIVCCPKEEDWFGSAYTQHDRSSLLPITWKRINQ